MSDWNKGPNSGDDDDLNFDWLNDDDKISGDSSTSDRTGVTGNLTWQRGKGADDDLPNVDDDDLTFDWSTPGEKGTPGVGDRTGVTGTLDWQRAMGGRASDDEPELSEDWQAALTPLETPPPPAADDFDLDALFGADAAAADNLLGDEEQPYAEDDVYDDALLTADDDDLFGTDDASWLDDVLDEPDDEPVAASPVQAVPDWLAGLDLPETADTNDATAHDVVSDGIEDWEDQEDLNADGEPDWLSSLPGYDVDAAEDAAVEDEYATFDETQYADASASAWGETQYADDTGNAWEQGAEDIEAVADDEFAFDDLFGEDEAVFAPDATSQTNDDLDLDALFGQEMAQSGTADDVDALFGADDNVDALFGTDDTTMPAEDEFADLFGDDAGETTYGDFDFGDDEAQLQPADDFDFAAVASDEDDPFAFAEQEEQGEISPDWLDSLEDVDFDTPEPAMAAVPYAEDDFELEDEALEPAIDIDQLLADLDNQPVTRSGAAMGAQDLDALFGEDDDEFAKPAMRAAPDELDAMFADSDFSPAGSVDTFETDEETFEIPDWLRDAATSTEGTLSAAGIIRQQKDRPLEELDDRLLALRESGLSISTEQTEDKASTQRLANVLPGVKEALIPTTLPMTEMGLDTGFKMTPEQTKNAQMLLGLVGLSAQTSAAGDTVNVSNRRAKRQSLPIARVGITLILLIAVLVPFFVPINLGTLPPLAFPAGSDEEMAFNRIQALAPEAQVLVAIEYTSTGAAELDDLTQMLLTHILQRGARPILVGTQPVGLLHAESLLTDIAGEAARNRAYYVIGYLPGTTLGLRNLATNPQAIFDQDIRGATTGLLIDDLDDFALIVMITENVDNLRNWMEQVAPSVQTPFVVASGFAAMPLIAPYTNQRADIPLLVGYQDAYTYNALLRGEAPPAVPTETATEQPTEVIPLATAEVVATEQIETTQEVVPTVPTTAVPTALPTITPSPTLPPTNTATVPPPTATQTATLRPTVTPSPTTPPTNTPSPTPTIEPLIEVGTVGGTATINARTGPGISFGVAAQLQQGTQVRVLGYNDQRDWVQIQLPDGREAWIAAFLITIETIPESQFPTPAPESGSRQIEPNTAQTTGQTQARRHYMGLWRLQRPHPARLEQQATPAPESTPDVLPAAATPFFVDVTVPQIENRENRWQAMTLGILAAVILITLGNIYYIVRGLLRR